MIIKGLSTLGVGGTIGVTASPQSEPNWGYSTDRWANISRMPPPTLFSGLGLGNTLDVTHVGSIHCYVGAIGVEEVQDNAVLVAEDSPPSTFFAQGKQVS